MVLLLLAATLSAPALVQADPALAGRASADALASRPNPKAERVGAHSDPKSPSAPAQATPVSTSPVLILDRSTASKAPAIGLSENGLPLTRAATQKHVESMSPVEWLAQYGSVRIARPR